MQTSSGNSPQFSLWEEADVRKSFLTGSTKYSRPQSVPSMTIEHHRITQVGRALSRSCSEQCQLCDQSRLLRAFNQSGLVSLQRRRLQDFTEPLPHCQVVLLEGKVSPYNHSGPHPLSCFNVYLLSLTLLQSTTVNTLALLSS